MYNVLGLATRDCLYCLLLFVGWVRSMTGPRRAGNERQKKNRAEWRESSAGAAETDTAVN
jgi:hypothetical protein